MRTINYDDYLDGMKINIIREGGWGTHVRIAGISIMLGNCFVFGESFSFFFF